ncbi:MAG TPA: carboxypeptidase-like regulatory domain-containing protein [Pyrinomonadaceae bacterium]|nr:carboxypeptidase-like regulatory domain-containing protein [Pyrinomonadaceae bacterium]
MPAKKHFIVLLGCFALCAAQSPMAFALRPRSPLKLEIKTVDPSTGKRKTTYSVGEVVSVVFTLTNRGRTVRRIKELGDTEISVKLTWKYNRSDQIDFREGVRGGTGGAYTTPGGDTFWTSRDPRYIVISPGQSIKVEIDDLRRFFAIGLDDGEYTLRADYGDGLIAQCSFKVVIDEAKSVPILEKMVKNGRDGLGTWADNYLRLIRQPSISGRIVVARGKGLKGVLISVTGSEKTNIETRTDGLYDLTHMMPGGTYVLTPSLEGHTFDPPSRTIRNLSSKLGSVNFTARRIPTGLSVFDEDGSPPAGAFSTCSKGDAFGAEYVISELQSGGSYRWRYCVGSASAIGFWRNLTLGMHLTPHHGAFHD